MIPFICGTCLRPRGETNSTFTMEFNGRNSVAQKSSELKAIQEIDQYTDLTFPVVGTNDLDEFMKYPFVPLIEHPGIVLIAKDKSTNDVVVDMIIMIFNVWPLYLLNLMIMFMAGFTVWILVSKILFLLHCSIHCSRDMFSLQFSTSR